MAGRRGIERVDPDAVTVWLSRVAGDPRPQARALLIRAAARVLDEPADGIEVLREPGGRPCLGGRGAGLHVSVSHSRGVVAVVTTTVGPVGVDVETVRPIPVLDMARRWLPPAEAAWVRDQEPDRQL